MLNNSQALTDRQGNKEMANAGGGTCSLFNIKGLNNISVQPNLNSGKKKNIKTTTIGHQLAQTHLLTLRGHLSGEMLTS